MSFWSSVFQRSPARYSPWSGPYFAQLSRRQEALLAAKPLSGVAAPDGYAVVEQRESAHHAWLTLRKPEEGLFQLKRTRRQRLPAAAGRAAEEVSLLVGLSTSYHLAPLEVFADPESANEPATLFSYCCGSLEGRAAAGKVPAAELVHYGLQLAAELADLHAAGIHHLAVAPANVLIERVPKPTFLAGWRLLLANFDLRGARAGERPPPVFEDDPFLAPELLADGAAGAQTDLWGLGATLFFLATGRSPRQLRGAAAVLPALAQLPAWLAEAIAELLALDPARRPPGAVALFERLLAHVRLCSDAGREQGWAGAGEQEAQLEIAERFLLAGANRLGKVEGGPVAAMNDLGWLTRFKEANRLAKAGSPSALRRAVQILAAVLGEWDEPRAPLGQFAGSPRGPVFQPREPPERWIGKERWGTAGLPLPIGLLWAMLDLQCKCLVSLVEEQGRPEEIARLAELCRGWLATGSFGTQGRQVESPVSYPAATCLTRLALGLRYAGELERAWETIGLALRLEPRDRRVLLAGMVIARDAGETKAASALGERGAKVATEEGSRELFEHFFALGADLAFRTGDYERAEELYGAMLKDTDSPELENLARQLRCRLRGKAEPRELERALETIEGSRKLEQWVAAVELACLAGRGEKARELIAEIRAEPRFNLPSDRWYHREIARLEAGIG